MAHLTVEEEAYIFDEELNEELVDALSMIMGLLGPMAADEETTTAMDTILQGLLQSLEQKTDGTQRPASGTPIVLSPSDQPGKRKRKRRRKRK